ncbi:MAG TPA: glucoamylase family protein [Bryobacteraceae bacterium]|nr:glucoamylase family protein [Bryobacteraceae bacterium]
MGSASHPIPPAAWSGWQRPKRESEPGRFFVESPAPLFVHQYSHAWFDFRGLRDGDIDYFENSRTATILHREFCIGLRDRFPWFSENMWGITASESRYGYIDWGGPNSAANAKIDGTLVPCAAGGSLVFLPEQCSLVLETMLERYGKRVWRRYGFVDAFHPEADWWAPDVLGIDLGIMLLMAENYQRQSVWRAMMAAPEVRRGFDAARFIRTAEQIPLTRSS